MKKWSVALATALLGFGGGWFFVGSGLHGQNAKPEPQRVAVKAGEVTSYRDVVKKVLPAVVSIETKTKIAKARTDRRPPRVEPQQFGGQQIPEEFRKFFEERRIPFPNLPSQPNDSLDETPIPRQGFGSGFFVDPSGVIVTNYHVVDGADSVVVSLQDGRKFNSKKVSVDRRTDLAVVVLDTKEKDFAYLELGNSDEMEIGDHVLAVGAPFGLAGTVTHGIISAKGRNGLNMNMYEDFIQTDAAINPGNSGGPLVNLQGQVIGINAAIKSRSGGFQGIGLAVASNLAKRVVHALRTEGVVHRGYLGVQIRELAPEVATRLGLNKDEGVVVADVFDNTPAAKAGLQAGDVIKAIAGKKVKDGKELQGIVADLPIGKATNLDVIRDGKQKQVAVTIEEQPSEFGTAAGQTPRRRPQAEEAEPLALDKLGVEIADLTEQTAESLGYRKGTEGVVITKVQTGTPASESGLRKGMLITKVDNQKVTTAAAARRALEAGSLSRGVLLQVQTPQGGTTFVLLRGEPAGE